jgi:hypothetical protein
MLRIGCYQQHARLLDLLSIARRAAMAPAERVDIELHERIESETAILNQSSDLPEPNTLLAALDAVDRAIRQLRELERRSSELASQIDDLPTPTIWKQLMGTSCETEKEHLQAKSEAIFAKIRKARSELASSKHTLALEQAKFTQERSQHGAALAVRRQQAAKFIKTGETREPASHTTLNLGLLASLICCGLRHCLERGTPI